MKPFGHPSYLLYIKGDGLVFVNFLFNEDP
jgi:hypothetical protein